MKSLVFLALISNLAFASNFEDCLKKVESLTEAKLTSDIFGTVYLI